MRAHEFITEATRGNIGKRKRYPTRGLNLFYDPSRTDSTYTLNRVMMAAACSDGKTPLDMDAMSWVGNDRTAHPYTDVEQEMLKQAYKATGAAWKDLNHGDMDSEELPSTGNQSPIKGFKGYPR